nr:hypothetical protein [uncultured Cellulosilyticum sp.]
MNQIGFNILRRAQDNAKEADKLSTFFKERGVQLKEVRRNPDRYADMIKQYSKICINEGLFEESRDRLQLEFNRLCEYHQRNEEALTKEFMGIAKEIILTMPEELI